MPVANHHEILPWDSIFHVACRNSIEICVLAHCRAVKNVMLLDYPAPCSSEVLEDSDVEDDEAERGEVHINRSRSFDVAWSQTEEEKVCEVDKCVNACMVYVHADMCNDATSITAKSHIMGLIWDGSNPISIP